MLKYQKEVKDINGLIIIDGEKQTVDVSQRQWKKKLLCGSCEGLLSKNETKMAKWMKKINDMEHRERINCMYSSNFDSIKELLDPKYKRIEVDQYLSELFINKEKETDIKFFVIGYLLRHLYVIDNTLDKKIIKLLEDHILGVIDYKIKLIIKVNSGEQSCMMFSSVFTVDKMERYKHYNFMLPNMWFHVIFDEDNVNESDEILILPEDFDKDEHIQYLFRHQAENLTVKPKAKQVLDSVLGSSKV
ncbi:hypothetical protein A9D46_10390 [Photobacterium damselae subsp. damselae]|nr:hypothetical protein A9D46_10390 [Photobacterium damselae subsp. damselae]